MAVTKDAAVCPVVRRGPAEPMWRCGGVVKDGMGLGGDRTGIWVSVNRWGNRRGTVTHQDSPKCSGWSQSSIYHQRTKDERGLQCCRAPISQNSEQRGEGQTTHQRLFLASYQLLPQHKTFIELSYMSPVSI
jgi:hypothetical protein